MKKIRTRYAPSPTGFLHIGGARTALFSYLYAKHYNGDFIFRIEDTDISRNIKNSGLSQLENLIWLGIIPDESPKNKNPKYGPYYQSKKLNRYNELIKLLLEKNLAYKAFDSTNELDKQKKEQIKKGVFSFRYDKNWLKISQKEKKEREKLGDYTIRIKLKKNKIYSWNDIVYKKMKINTNDIGDFIIKKRNGYPTYNFTVVVDDHDMEITNVLRGEEHISNTSKQLIIYEVFGWKPPKFGHLTTIINKKGQKLSKRNANLNQFIQTYKNDGYSSQGIFNFLTLLGWTHPKFKEKMTKQEIIKSFDPNRLSKSPSKFDIKKMEWFSKEYIKNTPNKILALQLIFENKSKEWINLFIETYKKSAININDLKNSLKIYDNFSIKKYKKNSVVKKFAHELNKQIFNIKGINAAINQTKKITKIEGKNLYMPIRQATTYQNHGPVLAIAIYLFGEKLIKERLK